MRDFLIGLTVILSFVLISLGLGIIICRFITLSPGDNNLFVKGMIGALGLIGAFVFGMLCTAVGDLFSKNYDN